jgi:putative endonuclease
MLPYAAIYIMASKKNGTIYIGVTSNLPSRVDQHKEGVQKKSFTTQYKVDKLVYYEFFDDINEAILRETQLKRWNRSWKLDLIEKVNPGWRDLSYELLV